MIVSAALQLLASRILFARGDFKAASTLANDSRQNVAAAHEYAAKRAASRPKESPRDRIAREMIAARGEAKS